MHVESDVKYNNLMSGKVFLVEARSGLKGFGSKHIEYFPKGDSGVTKTIQSWLLVQG
jgi:hypothetical protein